MSQFTPNSASSAPQGFPVPGGQYQAPGAPKAPKKRGSAGVWIAVVIVLAIICGFFLMRALAGSGSSNSTSDPSSSVSSTPTPTSSYLDEGITVEITTENRKACYKAVDESGKMDAISIIKTRSVRNQGQTESGDSKYTYTASLTATPKGATTESTYEVTCNVVNSHDTNKYFVDGDPIITPDPASSH